MKHSGWRIGSDSFLFFASKMQPHKQPIYLLLDGTAVQGYPDDDECGFPTREACETALLTYLAASDCDWRPNHVLPEDYYA